jgi:glycosyltransferase involved in cell wall biosynthesis
MDIQFVSKHRIAAHGTTQLRCVQPAEVLNTAGYRVSVNTIYHTRPIANKAIILHRVVYDDYTRAFINEARARAVPLIYDTDDLLFSKEGSTYLAHGQKAEQYRTSYKRFATAMGACDHVSASTQFLANQAALIHPQATIIKNALSGRYLQFSSEVVTRREKRKSKNITLAYLSGSKSHNADFAVIKGALLRVLKKLPQTRLLLAGPLDISADFEAFGDRIVRHDFKPYAQYPYIFENIDINLIPLEIEQAFCQAKSELKFIEAGACEVVSVATPTAPHISVIRHLENGLLVEADNWETSLIQLIENKTMRKALGAAARKTVLSHYTPQQSLSSWVELIESVKSKGFFKPVTQIDRMVNSASLNTQYWKRKLRRVLSEIANR